MWLAIIVIFLIILFMLFLTHKPLKKLKGDYPHARFSDNTAWGAAQYGVSEEALTPFRDDPHKIQLFHKMLSRMDGDKREETFMKAILFGLEIASHSDDYGKVGIEFEDEAKVDELLKRVDMKLADSELYPQYQFYARSILTLQDMLEGAKSAKDKAAIQEALDNYTQKVKAIEEDLRKEFKGLNRHELGTKHDREEFYFKVGITNYLRGKNLVLALDQLYRAYGVNYQVDDGFRAVTHEFPVFKEVLTKGLEAIGDWSFLELQQFVRASLEEKPAKPLLKEDDQEKRLR